MGYLAPADELARILETCTGFGAYRDAAGDEAPDPDTLRAILEQAGTLASEVWAPVNRAGDLDPAVLENGVVRTPPGYSGAYRQLAEGGWVGMVADPEHGGMGLPVSVAAAVHDMLSGACLSLQLNPLMTQGQIVALQAHGSPAQKRLYLPKLATGEWAGTMNLTEPQAGSDVGAIRSRAEPVGDGTYRVTGQKIFISWGDSDLTANVCHLVLARLPGAPDGTRGISLFLVPKFLPDEAGDPGDRNALRVVSLEHKLGLGGSPTAVMSFDGATGWLVGAEHGGMAAIFTMMNDARLGVGVQGVGVAEAALQHACAFAAARTQGRSAPTGTILDYPDVRRMLVSMQGRVTAARAICLACAVAIDMDRATADPFWAARAAFLTPIAKAFGTDTGIAVADTGIQVHGGMGVIEETGAAQYLRDVRVTAIYEGTNGIQAMDLAGRKLRDGGEAAFALLDEIAAGAEAARPRLPDLARPVWDASEALRDATDWMLAEGDLSVRFAGAAPYLAAWGLVLGAHFHLRLALADGAPPETAAFARSYVLRQLPMHAARLAEATLGAGDLAAVPNEALGA